VMRFNASALHYCIPPPVVRYPITPLGIRSARNSGLDRPFTAKVGTRSLVRQYTPFRRPRCEEEASPPCTEGNQAKQRLRWLRCATGFFPLDPCKSVSKKFVPNWRFDVTRGSRAARSSISGASRLTKSRGHSATR
jgi:hypothetical protein